MARTTYVRRARRSRLQRYCIKCGRPINTGDPYKWFATRIGRSSHRKYFCDTCLIRPSDKTESPNLRALYLAIEAAEDALEAAVSPKACAQILRDCAEGVREVQGMYTESADNIAAGFRHETPQSAAIREKAQKVEGFANELDRAADEIERLDDPDAAHSAVHDALSNQPL